MAEKMAERLAALMVEQWACWLAAPMAENSAVSWAGHSDNCWAVLTVAHLAVRRAVRRAVSSVGQLAERTERPKAAQKVVASVERTAEPTAEH